MKATNNSAYTLRVIFVLLVILGLVSIPLLRLRLHSSLLAGTITVSFQYGEEAEQVERMVTSRLEGILSTIPGIKEVNSVTYDGYGIIALIPAGDRSMSQIRYEVSSLIREIYNTLPEGTSYPQVKEDVISGHNTETIVTYALYSKNGLPAVQDVYEKLIAPLLESEPAISEVTLSNEVKPVHEINCSRLLLQQYGLSPRDIEAAVDLYFSERQLGSVTITGAGDIGEQEYLLRLTPAQGVTLPTDVLRVPLAKAGDRMICLRDVASGIKTAPPLPDTYFRINGMNALSFTVSVNRSANFLQTGQNLKHSINSALQSMPPGFYSEMIYDATGPVWQEMQKILIRFFCTLSLISLLLLVFTRNYKYVLLMQILMTSNIVISCILYYVLGIEVHMYALAGITVSIGIAVDQLIMMVDHYSKRLDRRIFRAIAGTVFTIAASLVAVYFLNDLRQYSLTEFVWVVLINLLVTLLLTCFFVPALMTYSFFHLPLPQSDYGAKRRTIKAAKIYKHILGLFIRWRWGLFLATIFLWGIPVFLLPPSLEGKDSFSSAYNRLFEGLNFKETIRPSLDKYLGGTFRLFMISSNWPNGSMTLEGDGRSRIILEVTLPQGAAAVQLNNILHELEIYLLRNKQVDKLFTHIHSGRSGTMEITFLPAFENTSFPYYLKNSLEAKAVTTGLADFRITGEGQGFSNKTELESTNYGLFMYGYSYDKLQALAAQFKKEMLKVPRISKVYITANRLSSYREELQDAYILDLSGSGNLLMNGITKTSLRQALQTAGRNPLKASYFYCGTETLPFMVHTTGDHENLWDLLHQPLMLDSTKYTRMAAITTFQHQKASKSVIRNNQEYQLVINYDFIGNFDQGRSMITALAHEIKDQLPHGFRLKENAANVWGHREGRWLLSLIAVMIITFLVCCVVLNNLRQALLILLLIPVADIGIFLVMHLVRFEFDAGGYAAFVVLNSILVNCALLLLVEYNILKNGSPTVPDMQLYIKAVIHKFMPLSVSLLSIIAGFVPFIVFSAHAPFWYALSVCITGGVVFILLITGIYLPVFLFKRPAK